VHFRDQTQPNYGLAAYIDLLDVHAIVKVDAVVGTSVAANNVEKIQLLELMPLPR